MPERNTAARAVTENSKRTTKYILLSSVYYTRLGDYGDDYFTDPVIQNHLAEFQQELLKIEEEINERNKTRTPYEFLLPSKIPQSINI